MALKSIEFNNFRCWSNRKIELSPNTNSISGKNGAGKTTIREAICFAFCGTDSTGTKNPQHLIMDDRDSVKVTITTDKVEISRSLSRKGNGTIKLVRAGVPSTLTQTQLETMLGSSDLFLSSFIPGYFLRLSAQKQTEVLNSVLPKPNRLQMIQELSGVQLTNREVERFRIERRPDVVASAVSLDRRQAENQINQLKGELGVLQSTKPLDKPVEPPEVAELALIETLKIEFGEYDRLIDHRLQVELKAKRVTSDNEVKKKRRSEVEALLTEVQNIIVPDKVDYSSKEEALRKQLPSLVSPPHTTNLPGSDNCPSCGQTVGLKHRDKITKLNQKIQDKYDSQTADWALKTAEVEAQLEELACDRNTNMEGVRKAIKVNVNINLKRDALEREALRLVIEEVPEIPPVPVQPKGIFNQEGYDKCFSAIELYKSNLSRYNYVSEEIERSEGRVEQIDIELGNLAAACDRYRVLERGLNEVPKEEMKLQLNSLKMKDVSIKVNKGVHLTYKGIPYELLSAGNTVKADTKLCLKLNSLSKRPLNMVFIDNFDLVDELKIEEDNIQLFTAHVVAGQDEVVVTH